VRRPCGLRRIRGSKPKVHWGEFRYQTPGGGTGKSWALVMVLSWSRAMYGEYVSRADVATFIRCHLERVRAARDPPPCLYDSCKVVVLDRDEAGQPYGTSGFSTSRSAGV